MERGHVSAVVATLRHLSDERASGKAVRDRIVREALISVDLGADLELAHNLLSDELALRSGSILAEVDRLQRDDHEAAEDGMLWLDAAIVRLLAEIDADEATKARAKRIASFSDPDKRWQLWADAAAPSGIVSYAQMLWEHCVQSRWLRGTAKPPAVVNIFAKDRWLPLTQPGTRTSDDGERVLDGAGNSIATFASADTEIVRRLLPLFRTVVAHKLWAFFHREVHRAQLRGETRPDLVRVGGGLRGLALRIGSDDSKADQVRDLLELGRTLNLTVPGLEVHGLWTWNKTAQHAPGQAAILEVRLNEPVFLGDSGSTLKALGGDTRAAKRDRQLVPILSCDPPHRTMNPNEWGPSWSVASGVVVLLVEGRLDLAREGGVLLDEKAWRRLGQGVGLGPARIEKLKTCLVEGDGVSPPLLTVTTHDRYTFADAHANARAFVLKRGSRGGKA